MSNSFEIEQEPKECASVAEIAENIVYRLPGCSDLMIRKTIQAVYRDFCRRSCALRTVNKFDCGEDREYPIVPMLTDCLVDTVAEVRLDGRKLSVNDHFVFRGNRIILTDCIGVPNALPDGMQGDEGLFSVNVPRTVETSYGKEHGHKLEIVQIEIPKVGAENAPQWFINKFEDALASGVLARLMAMTGKAWSDPNQAQAELITYENAVSSERMAYYSGSSEFGTGDAVADGATSELWITGRRTWTRR